MSSFPDYYAILNVQKTATAEEIRQAYKRESLRCLWQSHWRFCPFNIFRTHPDRQANATEQEKRSATERFQAVAEAYIVLSDPVQRKEYDTIYSSKGARDRTNDPKASSNFFAQFASMFGGAAPGQGPRPDAENVFADVFDELLRPEVEHHAPWWTYLGAISGGGRCLSAFIHSRLDDLVSYLTGLGFIVANLPGLMIGAYAGNRIGAIRDAKGKSVAAVFSQLGGSQKAEILRALAAKVLGATL